MANIYDIRRYGTVAFLAIAVGVAIAFLSISNSIVRDLSAQERARMEIWAQATEAIIATAGSDEGSLDLPLHIIASNTNIPVILTDASGAIIDSRNVDMPEPPDSLNPLHISLRNQQYLARRLEAMKRRGEAYSIPIAIAPGVNQQLYYEDSRLLRMLGYYPYIQMIVMAAFIAMVYYAVISTKKAEQNKVWVGLSKETAHQLGTPISSLMAWLELLQAENEATPPGEAPPVDPEALTEMNKDVTRLSTIASRFGKIGSRPTLEPVAADTVLTDAVSYMRTRISPRIVLDYRPSADPLPDVRMRPELFQWVMENLIKNAVDAMDSPEGRITVTSAIATDAHGRPTVTIRVSDTGKGIPKKRFRTIFNPGYTTKKRGWGLGLALAKRIIEQYHRGRIFVAESEPGRGTTFQIDLPCS